MRNMSIFPRKSMSLKSAELPQRCVCIVQKASGKNLPPRDFYCSGEVDEHELCIELVSESIAFVSLCL